MPTQSTTYNSRVTDESLEKRFRDTFRAQGGAELVDDLYAQGVIVPIVDFTAAATGNVLGTDLQTAWDFTTGFTRSANSTDEIIDTAGFWLIDTAITVFNQSGVDAIGSMSLSDGFSTKKIYQISAFGSSTIQGMAVNQEKFVVFVRSGDSVSQTATGTVQMNTVYRQIATVNGDLVNPSGFSSS